MESSGRGGNNNGTTGRGPHDQMSSTNRFITGPAGHWVNSILMGISIFFLTQLYSDVKEWSEMLYQIESRVSILEFKNGIATIKDK